MATVITLRRGRQASVPLLILALATACQAGPRASTLPPPPVSTGSEAKSEPPPREQGYTVVSGPLWPGGVLTADEGIFVTDEAEGSLWEIVPRTGNARRLPGPFGGLAGPGAMAIDDANNLFVVEREGARVICRDPAGRWVTVMGGGEVSPGPAPVRATDLALRDPVGVAIPDGESLWVLDAGLKLLLERQPDGRASGAPAPGTTPVALGCLADGRLIVLDGSTGTLHLGRPGSWQTPPVVLHRPLAVAAGRPDTWAVLETDGTLVTGPDGQRRSLPGVRGPVALMMDREGRWAVADTGWPGLLLVPGAP